MPRPYILIIGKPDLGAKSIEKIHQRGFDAALLMDTAAPTKYESSFDLVIPIDFSRFDEWLDSESWKQYEFAGTLCTYENYITAKAKFSEKVNLPSLSLESALLTTDKIKMREAFAKAAANFTVPHIEVHNEKDLLTFADRVGYPLILKPANLVKSLLVTTCHDEYELLHAYTHTASIISDLYKAQHIYDRQPAIIAEKFIVGQMYSIAGFTDARGELISCDDPVKLTTAAQIGFDDTFLFGRTLGDTVDVSVKERLHQAAHAGVKALSLTSSAAHIELIDDGSQTYIIEIGARIGGYRPRMYEIGRGIDMLGADIDICLDHEPDLQATQRKSVGVYEMFAHTTGALESVKIPNPELFTYVSNKVKVGSQTGPSKDGFRAPVIAIAVAETDEQMRAIETAAREIKVKVVS